VQAIALLLVVLASAHPSLPLAFPLADLKPENILLVGEGEEEREQIMLADFGLGAFALPDQAMKLPCGTLTFTAPDVLNGKGYGMEVDLWSCGVICFLLLRGSLPFDGKTTEEIREKITHGRYQLDGHQVWNEVSQECKDLIRGLLTVDPSQRLTCQQALDHPFFKLKFPSSSAAAHAPAATTSTVTTPAAGPTVSPPVAAASPEANAASTAPHTPAQLDLDAMSNSLTLSSSQQPTGSGGGGSIDVSPFTDTAKTSTVPSASSTPSLPLSHATSPLPRRDAATAAPGVGMAEDYSSSLSSNLTGVTYAYGTAGSSTGNSQPNSLTSSLVLQSQPPPPPPAESEYVLPAPTPASTARASLSAMSPIPIEDRPFQEPTGRRGSVASSPHLLHQVEFTSPESSQGDSLASPPAHYISPQPHLVSMQASPGSEDSEILNRRDSD
jgi:serine/threonine protein kinase